MANRGVPMLGEGGGFVRGRSAAPPPQAAISGTMRGAPRGARRSYGEFVQHQSRLLRRRRRDRISSGVEREIAPHSRGGISTSPITSAWMRGCRSSNSPGQRQPACSRYPAAERSRGRHPGPERRHRGRWSRKTIGARTSDRSDLERRRVLERLGAVRGRDDAQAGPIVVASLGHAGGEPFAKRGFVDHTFYDERRSPDDRLVSACRR